MRVSDANTGIDMLSAAMHASPVYRMFKESKEKVIADGAIVTDFEDMDIDAFKALALPIQDKFAADNNMTAELEMIRAAAN